MDLGETEEDFNELLDFVKQEKFERMGAFAYSEEEGTYSAIHYKDDVPADVKQARLDKLMAVHKKLAGKLKPLRLGRLSMLSLTEKKVTIISAERRLVRLRWILRC